MVSDGSLPCPGGTGKKIKFCCAELGGELRQIDRLVQGGQLTTALERTKQLAARHPGRACLFAVQANIELATDRLAAASGTARAFLAAHPDNQVAVRQAALTAALAGRIDEAAAAFDRARAAAIAMKSEDVSPLVELVQIAPTVVQASIDAGHPGCGQGIIDWLVDTGAVAADVLRPLVESADSTAVPIALRDRRPLSELAIDVAWRPAFDEALAHARDWRLAIALDGFRGLQEVAGGCRPLLANIGLLCEMLARPREAAEAWREVSRLDDTPDDVAVEAIGRAIALETEADPDRGPLVTFVAVTAPLERFAETGVIERPESRLRGDPQWNAAPIDEAAWTKANAAVPRSAWWVCEARRGDGPPLILASLLVFDRGEGRGPEAVLRGFDADLPAAKAAAERLLECRFGPPAREPGMPVISPTAWLLASQFHQPDAGMSAAAVADRETSMRERFIAVWPDTPLPELLGRTPRQAVEDPEGLLRVEAVILEGEASAGEPAVASAWAGVRAAVGLPAPGAILAERPLDDVSPMRWHLLDMASLPTEQLQGLAELSRDAGFDAAALLAAEAIATRADGLSA